MKHWKESSIELTTIYGSRWTTRRWDGTLLPLANMIDSKPFRPVVEFMLDWHLDDVPAGTGALTRRYLDRNPEALKPSSIDCKSLWQEFAGPAAQGYGQWRSFFWTERSGAIHE